MSSHLAPWYEKLQAAHRNTSFREFLMTYASWAPTTFYRNGGLFSSIPPTERSYSLIEALRFDEERMQYPQTHSREYDPDRPFLDQLHDLLYSTPVGSIVHIGSENCDFSDISVYSKNCYLSSVAVYWCDNILYSHDVKDDCINIISSFLVWQNSENVYWSSSIIRCMNVFYSRYILNSSNVWFSSNLVGCHDCLFCDWLENQKYCIENKQYEKDEYMQRKKKILEEKDKFEGWYRKINKVGRNYGSTNVQGNFILESENVSDSHFCYHLSEWRNCLLVWGSDADTRIVNCISAGTPNSDSIYWLKAGAGDNIYSCFQAHVSNLFYSLYVAESSFCLWCVGLKNAHYCILNKQYTREEWFETAEKIFASMQREWVLGQFFPASMNPYYFNDTMAHLIGKFSKEEVTKQWYMWRDEPIAVDLPENAEIIETKDINPHAPLTEDIMKKILKDAEWNYYRIVPAEYAFLQKHNLPIPRLHWLSRLGEHLG